MRTFRKVEKFAILQRLYFAKCSVWGENSYCQKHDKSHLTITLQLMYAKNLLEKAANDPKMTGFRKVAPLAILQRLYSLCKMVTLERKLILPKHAENYSTTILQLIYEEDC